MGTSEAGEDTRGANRNGGAVPRPYGSRVGARALQPPCHPERSEGSRHFSFQENTGILRGLRPLRMTGSAGEDTRATGCLSDDFVVCIVLEMLVWYFLSLLDLLPPKKSTPLPRPNLQHKKEFFFSENEAGMLLKTKETGLESRNVIENKGT